MTYLRKAISGLSCVGLVGLFIILTQPSQAQNLSIPIPRGLVEASKLSPVVKARAEAALTPRAILLGSFLTPDALASVLKTGHYEPDSYAVATLLENFKSQGECTERWKTLRNNMMKEIERETTESATQKRIFRRLEDNLEKISKEDVARIEGASSIGIALDNEHVIAASSIAAINFDPQGNAHKEHVVVTVGIQRVGNSLVSILVSEKFDGAESIRKSSGKLADWSALIASANLAVENQ